MARYKITVSGKGLRRASIDKLVKKMEEDFKECNVHVEDATPPESRSERFAEAMGYINDCKSELESLKEELEEWKESIPENLQSGQKASDLDDAINDLDTIISSAEDLEGQEVNFPSMM